LLVPSLRSWSHWDCPTKLTCASV